MTRSDLDLDATEPTWPDQPGPYVFLIDASSRFEEQTLKDWVRRHRPGDVAPSDVDIAAIPASRRRHYRRSPDPKLPALLDRGDDPLMVPMRIVWLAPEREGRRRVGWRDLLTFGDPRDPDFLRARVIAATHPERMRVVMGEPARLSELRARWEGPEGRSHIEAATFTDFVALQAWLALERAERRLRGNRYKVPKFLREDLFLSPRFVQGVQELARTHGVPFEQMAKTTYKYLREIAATHSPYVIDLVAGGVRWLLSKAYSGLHYDPDELQQLYSMGQRHPLVFLPSHKSNFDHLALMHVLYENELPPNHTAGGINMNFFPIGPLIRRTGVFFIRREFKDNEPYKFVLRRYLEYLLEKRFPLEWYIEGGRSRTGKLRAPRLGMLAYVVDGYRHAVTDDVILIPVSIAYDQIQDVGAYAAEQRGRGKERESFGWFLKALRSVRQRYGSIHMRFGRPVSLRAYLGPPDPDHAPQGRDLEVPKLAFEVATRINEVTPITPISLVALALLTAGDRALTVEETIAVLEPFITYVKRRELPVTVELALDTPARVERALLDLVNHGVVTRFEGATDTVYKIGADQHLAAAYYRNTIIHFFVNGAITELALIEIAEASAHGPLDDPDDALLEATVRLRDLLKFEFFFSPRERFRHEIVDELDLQDPQWRTHFAAGEIREVLLQFSPFRSPAVLRPFFEAYRVVGDLVEAKAYQSRIDGAELRKEALRLGEQYLLQGRIKTADSVSAVIFDSAVRLAENRGLLEPHADMIDRRLAFAAELRNVVRRLDVVDAVVAGRAAGILAGPPVPSAEPPGN